MFKFTFLIPIALFLLVSCAPSGMPRAELSTFETVPEQWGAEPVDSRRSLDSLLALAPDDRLQSLVKRALAGNPDLEITALRFQEAGLLVRQSRAGRRPRISTTSSVGRSSSVVDKTSNRFEIGLSAGWEVDLWGRLRAEIEAEQFSQQALAEDLNAAKTALVGQVMKSWLSLISQQQQLQLAQMKVNNLKLAVQIAEERYRSGLSESESFNEIKTEAALSLVDLNERLNAVQQSKRKLMILLGEQPQTEIEIPDLYPSVSLPEAELPADVVGRRPDLIAAYRRIQAADQNVLVAYRNLLPRFRLSFDANDSRSSIADLLKSSPTWSLIGALTAPLFEGGRLQAEANRSEYEADIAFLNYRRALLNAFIEVENALAREHVINEKMRDVTLMQTYAEVDQQKYRDIQRQGMADMLTLLAYGRSVDDAKIRKAALEGEQLINRINLALAVGIGLPSKQPMKGGENVSSSYY